MARKPGGAKTVDEETIDSHEDTNMNRAISMAVNLLKSHKVSGINGEIGNYDLNLVEDCCSKLLRQGAVNADTGYGIIISRQYFEAAGLK